MDAFLHNLYLFLGVCIGAGKLYFNLLIYNPCEIGTR